MKAPIADVDFGKTADDYLTHRAGFPESLFDRLVTEGIGGNRETMIDLGTGTGTLGRGFAQRGCSVTGIDPSAPMIEAARRKDAEIGLDTNYIIASAEETTMPEQYADIVSAGQCWHWFDPNKACTEIKRILKPGGLVVLAHYDWIPLRGNVVRRTEELIEAHNPAWRMGKGLGIHPWALRELGENGFIDLRTFSYDEPAIYTHEGWRGRIRASAGIAATLDEYQVRVFDEEHAEMLAKEFPDDPLSVPHRVFVITARNQTAKN